MRPPIFFCLCTASLVAAFGSASAQPSQEPPHFLPPPPVPATPPGFPKPPSVADAPPGETETRPTSRALIAAVAALRSNGFSEASLRAADAGPTRTMFAVSGAQVALQSRADDNAPRLALGSKGGAAILVRLPSTAAGATDSDPAREPAYALASVVGSRVKIWAVYSAVPSDAALSRRMVGALLGVGAPLLTFDPTFVPGPENGPDRYLLK